MPRRTGETGPAISSGERFAESRRRPGLGTAGAVLWLAAVGIVVVIFVVANPLGLASDEPAHFFRAAGLAHGQMRGEPAPAQPAPYAWTPDMVAWTNRTSRQFDLPVRYACGPFVAAPPSCSGTRPTAGRIARISYVGSYPPAGYLPAAAGIRGAEALGLGPTATARAARAAEAVPEVVLLALAAGMLWRDRRRPSALLGLAVASTPLTLFTIAQVSDSGLEISSSLCFACGLLRLLDLARGRPSRGTWGVVTVAGVLFATARSTGPIWLAVTILAVAAVQPRQCAEALRRVPRRACAAAAIVGAGASSTLLWDALVAPKPHSSAARVINGFPRALSRLPDVAEQAIGRLSWLNVPLAPALVGGWWAVLAVLLVAALLTARFRQRLALLGLAAAAVGLVLAVDVAVIQPTSPGFPMQARYVYPPFLLVPLLAGHLLAARPLPRRWHIGREAASAAVLLLLVTLLVTATRTNAAAWRSYANLRPPLGWPVWDGAGVIAVLLALGAVAAMCLDVVRSQRPAPPGPIPTKVLVPAARRGGGSTRRLTGQDA